MSLRSLALWRIGIGLTAAYDVWRRWQVAGLLYSEDGLLPAEARGGPSWTLGPLSFVEGGFPLHLCFALSALVALAYALGAGTKYVKWLLLPVLAALHLPVPHSVAGGEMVLQLQAFYAMLLPIGETLSFDAWLARRNGSSSAAHPAKVIVTSVYPLLLLQLSVIYVFGVLCKTGDGWLGGTGSARALNIATMTTTFGAWFAQAPAPLLVALNWGTLAMEALLPFLILSPWARRKTHLAAAVLIVLLHGGIALTLDVGVWGCIMISQAALLWHPPDEKGPPLTRAPWVRRLEPVMVAFLVYVLAARLGSDIYMVKLPKLPLPTAVVQATKYLYLLQPWMMFSPDPPARDHVVVIDAVTASGRHFDPWRREILGVEKPLTTLPGRVSTSHLYMQYERSSASSASSPFHYWLGKWVFSQRPEERLTDAPPDPEQPGQRLYALLTDDPVVRFDAWAMIVPTRPDRLIDDSELDQKLGVYELPLKGALPVKMLESVGVWAPERAIDHKLVPEGAHVFSPVAAAMSAGCPSLTLDLGAVRNVQSAFIQTDGPDEMHFEGSLDGMSYAPLGKLTRVKLKHFRSRIVDLSGSAARYVRIRPVKSRGYRHFVSELALFDQHVTLPQLAEAESTRFYASRERPAVAGLLSASATPNKACPADTLKRATARPVPTPEELAKDVPPPEDE